MADAFYGEIRAFAFSFPPQDWAFCYGNALPMVQYQALYSVIGMTYGGSSSAQTFNLPDLRGRAPMHWGTGRDAAGTGAQSTPGTALGTPNVTLTATQMPTHTHVANGMQTGTGATLSNTPSQLSLISRPKHTQTNTTYDAWTTDTPNTTLSANSVTPACGANGPAQAHSNISPYLTFNFCICLSNGVYPVRN